MTGPHWGATLGCALATGDAVTTLALSLDCIIARVLPAVAGDDAWRGGDCAVVLARLSQEEAALAALAEKNASSTGIRFGNS